MQFVNNTDETIVLEPGEGVSGTTTVLSFQDRDYRLQIDDRVRYVDEEEQITSEDVEEVFSNV